MTPFYGWGSTASRLQRHYEETADFYHKFKGDFGAHLIDIGKMKDWVELVATQWV